MKRVFNRKGKGDAKSDEHEHKPDLNNAHDKIMHKSQKGRCKKFGNEERPLEDGLQSVFLCAHAGCCEGSNSIENEEAFNIAEDDPRRDVNSASLSMI